MPARERGLDVRAGALPHAIPLEAGRWDAVCLFDVLEHVDDEAGTLAACRRLLAPDGRLFVTVPAYAWLWSRHDELLGHRRIGERGKWEPGVFPDQSPQRQQVVAVDGRTGHPDQQQLHLPS